MWFRDNADHLRLAVSAAAICGQLPSKEFPIDVREGLLSTATRTPSAFSWQASSIGVQNLLSLCLEVVPMRTTVDIDERLIREAMALLSVNTKREAVQHSLEALVRQARRRRLRSKLGNIELDITLEELHEMRRDES